MSKSIFEMPTFREPCSLLQDKEQPDTELFLWAVPFYTLLVGVVGKKRIVGEGGGEKEERRNRSVLNNRENGLPHLIYVVAIISI